MSHDIIALPAFADNYIWMIIHRETNQAVVIDPGDPEVVIDALNQHQLNLKAILVTHHHFDHTNGLNKLSKLYSPLVYGPKQESIAHISHQLIDHSTVSLPELKLNFQVLAVPGHTLGHIAYVGHGWLFCGDTLFSAGCGRLFEGTAAQLYHSLSTLSELPPETKVYCTHEYTLNNLQFAKLVEPDNPAIDQYLDHVKILREKNLPSLPSTLAIEHKINPFLRCDSATIKQSVEDHSHQKLDTPLSIFSQLREWKNSH